MVAARDEVRALASDDGTVQSVDIGYTDDSDQRFANLEAWRDDPSLEAPDDIKSICIVLNGTAKVTVTGDAEQGLEIVAEGSETFANGVRATMKARLSGGADAGTKAAAEVPLPRWLTIALLIAVFPAVALGLYVHSIETYDPSSLQPLLIAVLGFAICGAPILGIAATKREERLPPRFQLVEEGDQFPTEKEDRSGPAWSVKGWLERHFVIGIFLNWLGAGVVGAIIALLVTKAI